ncbi:MAG: STAS domain-containing protein [bacterium]|nr:STAS domain-containing protein [bacterium]
MMKVFIEELRETHIIIVHIEGELNIESINRVKDIWYKQLAKKPKIIAINCTKLDKIDSSGIGSLVLFLNNAMKKKIKLVFFGLNYTIQRLFNKAKLNHFFTITTKSKFEVDYMTENHDETVKKVKISV